jgi:phospholipid N-methyltransferase
MGLTNFHPLEMVTTFFQEYVLKPGVVGAVMPSSQELAREMLAGLNLAEAGAILEYGPGTGAFTTPLLRRLPPTCRLVMIERNERFVHILRQRFPQQTICHASVTDARAVCDREGITMADCIISGLPWASFPEDLQKACLDAMMTVLRPGGQFVTFAYEGAAQLPRARRFRKKLGQYFSEVTLSRTVFLNVPPAFVYRCRR